MGAPDGDAALALIEPGDAVAVQGEPYALEAGDTTWSDSEAVQEAVAGIPVGLVSVPLR